MIQKYAFTTAAMAAALEDTPVSYEDLAEIEKDFDDAETEIIRQQVNLTAPLYARRHKTVTQIPNFWPLVLEQAPPDIDQYIQPSDSALLLSSLTSLSVRHFQLDETPAGDPRSVSVRWEFAENEYFQNEVLEKRFWYRRAKDGWCGLVSEPVPISWKKGKDLTGGLLDLVCKAWDADPARLQQVAGGRSGGGSSSSSSGSGDGAPGTESAKEAMTAEQKALKKKIDQTGMGGLSFFAWFGFIGRRVSARESEEATRREAERREGRRQGQKIESPVENESEEGGEGPGMSLEIFPDGDDLAVAITEDLWPGAIKYFIQAQEQDALSDADFESDEEGDEDDDQDVSQDSGSPSASRPAKKRRS